MFNSKSLLQNSFRLAKFHGHSSKEAYYIARNVVMIKYKYQELK